jgi:hypothetical protein
MLEWNDVAVSDASAGGGAEPLFSAHQRRAASVLSA